MFKIKVKSNLKSIKSKIQTERLQQLNKIKQEVTSELAKATPKDTGEAAADWSDSNVDLLTGTFTVTNSKEYVKYLNAGSSKQAPAFFIESTVLKHGVPEGTIVEYNE